MKNRRALEVIETLPQLDWLMKSPDLPHVLLSLDYMLHCCQLPARKALRRSRPKEHRDKLRLDASNLAVQTLREWLKSASVPLANPEVLINHISRFPLELLDKLPDQP